MMLSLLTVFIKFFTGCSGSSFMFHDGYNVSGKKVFFKKAFPGGTIEIPGADAASFKIIKYPGMNEIDVNKYFATDKNHVYYGGYKIQGSDGKSFAIIDENFAKDKIQCYFKGNMIPDAEPASFTAKEGIFSADKNHIYQRISAIDNDVSIFEVIDDSHIIRTANAVSVFEQIIELPPGAAFKYCGFNYFAINSQVYFHDKPLPDGTLKDFKPLNDFFSSTGRNVYYADKIIEGAKASSYRLLSGPYGRDNQHVFFFEKTITGADPDSFEILNMNFQCARDKHAVYHEDKKIENFTSEDLTTKDSCRQCNEQYIYFDKK